MEKAKLEKNATQYPQAWRRIWLGRETPMDEILRGASWPLLPIALGMGIAIKMNMPMLGAGMGWFWLVITPFVMVIMMKHRGQFWLRAILLLLTIALGFFRLSSTLDHNETKLMAYRYYGPIEGRIVEISQSGSGALRLTLDDVVLDRRKIHGMARVSLHGDYQSDRIWAGAFVQTTGHLSPANGPNEPGGYDFRKDAWLDGIAGVGYTRNPLIAGQIDESKLQTRLRNWRLARAKHLADIMGDELGGFAAAIFVGDRSGLDLDVVKSLRQSSLAHLLAISGMHVGIVMGLVFVVSRRILSLFPIMGHSDLGLRVAVILTILGGLSYLVITGVAWSALRAYLMALVFFTALAFSRRAFSLRTIVLAAIVILLYSPNALYDVGFQMSFAATTALVVVYQQFQIGHMISNSILRWVVVLLITSFVAGTATAPFSAFHFHNVPRFGLLANLLAVPVMGFVVMPAGVASFLLEPFGLDAYPLWFAGLGIKWIIGVSTWVSNFENPTWIIRKGYNVSLVLIILSGLTWALLQRLHWSFIALFMSAIVLWNFKPRPDLLITSDARFFGQMTGEGRKFSRATGHAFAAENWALADGHTYDQTFAFEKSDPITLSFGEGWRIVFTTTKKGAARIDEFCDAQTLIIAAQGEKPVGECVFFGEREILKMGGMAIDIKKGNLVIAPNIAPQMTPWQIR